MFSNNSIHPIFNKKELDEEEKITLGAINARMKRFKFEQTHEGTAKYPFKPIDIALALDYLDKTLKKEEYEAEVPVCQGSNILNAFNMPIMNASQ